MYTAFSRTDNVRELKVAPTQPLLWALDFNVDPMSSVIVQMVDGEVRVVDEIVLRRATTEQACAEFLKRYPNHPANMRIYGDASGNNQQTTGASDYEMVQQFLTDNSYYTGGLPDGLAESTDSTATEPDECQTAFGTGEGGDCGGSEVRGTHQGLRGGVLPGGGRQAGQRQRQDADPHIGRFGIPGLAGVQASEEGGAAAGGRLC